MRDPEPDRYVASARFDGEIWWVRITGPDGRPAGTTRTARLDAVEAQARQLLALAGLLPAEVVVEAELPLSVYFRLRIVDELRDRILRPDWIIDVQLMEAERELTERGLEPDEIALVLGDHTNRGAVAWAVAP